jgi:hypothetical protein
MMTNFDHPLAQKIAAFIEKGEADFDELALELFAYQYGHNRPYRQFCDASGHTPASVKKWGAIPAVPAVAFKRYDLSCVEPNKAALVFHSSGTSQGSPSRHFLDSDAEKLYDLSLNTGFRQYVLPKGEQLPIWALMPSFEQSPNSSLSYMLESLMREMPGLDHRFFWDEGIPEGFEIALRSAQSPLILFGTAFAWITVFDRCPDKFELPKGSLIIETGGFKGRMREVAPEELYQLFEDRLNALALSEYGMCEMASQFYDSSFVDKNSNATRLPRKLGVRWCRTRIIDPLSGQEVGIGERGLLTHFDLANFNSVAALQTEDIGVRMDEGFQLIGRAKESELRGCSLTVEELLLQ